MYHRMYSSHEEAEGGVSGFQMAPDVTLHPPLWLLRSLHPETRELFFRIKWASLPVEDRKLLPKANRIIIMLGSLEPGEPGAGGTLFNSEGMCAGSRPVEQAPA